MSPTKVRPKKLPYFKVLYNYNGFSIALGEFDKTPPKRLAMRWNETESNEVGYPCQGKNPTWFMLPDELSIPLILSIPAINALSNIKSAKSLLKVIKQLQQSSQKR